MSSWFYDDVKKRKRMFGIKTKDIFKVYNERERSDLVCPLSGDNDLLDFCGGFYVCDKCFRKFSSYEGVIAYPVTPLGIKGDIKCQFCGRSIVKDVILGKYGWYIYRMPISLKNMWHKLGGQKKPLKIFGDKLFY